MTRASPDGVAFADAASFSRKRKADDFEWESSKENVMPLKRGRNVADLNKALRAHDSFQTKLRIEDEMKGKEDAIAAYDGDDPLAGWLDYVRWLEVEMPEDTRKKFKVLEKCTRELKDNAKYRNDMRYIRLWIQYADLVSNPKDIFKYLYQNKIGERVSLFYIGWAYVLETMANYPQAHKIYLKASQRNAEPQDLLERKYKEFQRRMSRQWLRMTEETGVSELDERQRLHQHHASARAQRVQQENAHKPLGTTQQQDKENEIAPSSWNPPSVRAAVEAEGQPERRSLPILSSRADMSPLQRMEGVATEEEMLAQEPLKNFTASDKKLMQKQGVKSRLEKSCYNVELLISRTGEAVSFEEIRAGAYQQVMNRRRKLGHRALQDVSRSVSSAVNATAISSAAISAATTPATTPIISHQVSLPERKPAIVASASHGIKPAEPKPAPFVASAATASSDLVPVHDDQEDMTINTRVALEDINNMFCSPPRQPKPRVWEVKEDDPVERKLHFSVFDDSVDSVAVNAQDQSLHQDLNESIPKQSFQVFTDDVGEEPRTGNKSWSQKRKPLGARDDLVRSGRLTNKDILMQAEKDAAAKDSTKSVCFSYCIQGTAKNVAREGPPRKMVQSMKESLVQQDASKPVPALELDPYTFENRQALILDRRVDWYLCSRPDAVKLHPEKLPRIPCNNPNKRSFASVFSANVVDTTRNTTDNKAIKFEKEHQNLAWEFYITNKVKKKLQIENGIPDQKMPLPKLSGLHLFPNGALLIMDKGHFGTLFDVLNCYKQARVPFPEVLVVYYTIRMLRCIELLHGAHVLHGDIKPDNWLMTPGNPSLEIPMSHQELHNNKDIQAGDLYLIDYGRSIDLALYPEGTVFRGNCHAKGFQSVEMLTQRPWTYQIDTFALCGMMHCMLFGEYMEVKLRRNAKCTAHWGIAKPFKRYWQVDMWKYIFHALLNVRSCSDQPSLTELRNRLENYLVSDAGRQQELFKQLRRQEVFLRKSTA
ncbi:hypothetical protein PF005_g11666 [Phytophthora fragariae]|uniref:BUB protein kinase n=1 Tax=Phytophthora fragariae TaxID=53985 RepID=A0A6A3EYL3_9STRA|nr:hypothetical protein PF009_g12949 [Phytophthora fragariae]KAE9110195.1 hypothetical protein PF010_g11250 [Phytophthora fragariae]KAE9110516.1 hypothetical protein PF007_g11832 [Phytophthora fragariae]KAE9144162.1 hypothetical protein PF006_g10875 [Phytophthora fragariae]KAE9209841.1 hypothetical protein PF005_g11666 [Phytophthora fragariae]